MIHGVGKANLGIVTSAWKGANVHYLLGYNEPDPGHHPNRVTPAEAAKDWVYVQQVAEQHGLTLVSPALSHTGLDDQGVSPWMDQFLAHCDDTPGCDKSKIKYIAFHDYGGSVSKLLSRANGLMKRYGKPTWVTEIAINKWARKHGAVCDDCHITRSMQDSYMKEALPALDRSPAVHRYAWYASRDKPRTDINNGNLLVWNKVTPTLTSTGKVYKTHVRGSNN